jgi:predicted regulator of Ras-like GTPase activity (Roadblock/LC7/MglB family)
VLSPDGLLMSASRHVDSWFADHLAAASAGLFALAGAVGRNADGGTVHQAVIEMEYALMVVAPVDALAILAVVLDGAPDFTVVGDQIAEFARRVGEHLEATPPADPVSATVVRRAS